MGHQQLKKDKISWRPFCKSKFTCLEQRKHFCCRIRKQRQVYFS